MISSYDRAHLAVLPWLEAFLWLVLAVLALSALTLLVAWANDRLQRRGAEDDTDDRPEQFPPTHTHFTRHRHHF